MQKLLLSLTISLVAISGAAAAEMEDEIRFHTEWVDRVFGESIRSSDSIDRVVILHEDAPGDTKLGRCAAGGKLRLGDRVFDRGIGVNSHSVIRVHLSEPAERLKATVGLDRNVDNTPASVRFHVVVAGKDVWVSEIMRAGVAPVAMDAPLMGAKEFDLVVDIGGDNRSHDQADWGELQVVRQDGSVVWLDELARQAHVARELPFSFVYGGQRSSEFLSKWTRQSTVESLDGEAIRRTLALSDPATGLEVKAVCTAYRDTPGADWTLHFENKGASDSPPIEQVQALDALVEPGISSQVVLHRLNGSTCRADDWMPFDQSLVSGERIEFAATDGRSSNVCPFFNLDWGSGGVITAIGWSGQWCASVEFKEGRLRTQAGMQNMRITLRPGEAIRSPRILQLYWFGGDQVRSYNLFRRTMMSHILPRIDGDLVLPPIAHSSTAFYELNESNERNVLSHLRAIQGIGFETFWLDAYWTGPNGFPESMGNYGLPLERVEPRDRFPNGLRAISQAVRRDGLSYLMWFEPERVAPGTLIAKEHPQWVISPQGDGGGLFNLGLPEARRYMTDYLHAAIREYQLGCLRIDFNIDPLGYWRYLDKQDANRVGMAEIRYVEGLYQMWDEIRQSHPKLFIDNCASGGRRIDLETCSRAIPLWRSDNTCDMIGDDPNVILMAALKNQLMSAGLNRYVPYSTVGQMGASPYLFRSGFNAGIVFAQDVRPDPYPRDMLKQAIAEGKRIRHYWLGDFYPLSHVDTDPSHWIVTQFHRPTEQEGLVLAFRRHASPYGSYRGQLRELRRNAKYEVRLRPDYVNSETRTMTGDELRQLEIRIEQCPGSMLIEYRELPDR